MGGLDAYSRCHVLRLINPSLTQLFLRLKMLSKPKKYVMIFDQGCLAIIQQVTYLGNYGCIKKDNSLSYGNSKHLESLW